MEEHMHGLDDELAAHDDAPAPVGAPHEAAGDDVAPPVPDIDNIDAADENPVGHPVDAFDDHDVDRVPPGEPTGVQGDAPPIPDGADGDDTPFPTEQPGFDTPQVTLDGPNDDDRVAALGEVGEGPPPGEPTGGQADPPPMPAGAGGEGDPAGHAIDLATTDTTEVATDAPEDASTPAEAAHAGADATPGSIGTEAATELANALLPTVDATALVLDLAGDGDEVTVSGLIDAFREHGAIAATGDEHGMTSVEDVMISADEVHVIGSVGDETVPLTLDRCDGHMIVCIDPAGNEYEVRAEDLNRTWAAGGSTVLAAHGASPGEPNVGPRSAVALSPGLGDKHSLAAPGGTASLPAAEALPAIDVATAPIDLATDPTAHGGISGTDRALAGAAVLLPLTVGGGLLARRLRRSAV
jgi:hypothetical protein